MEKKPKTLVLLDDNPAVFLQIIWWIVNVISLDTASPLLQLTNGLPMKYSWASAPSIN
ncbi:MAG: hypothetical protein IPJ68_05900 [Candidatus Moraniibacteriota bacterium]|nr:MAG: hypothetical protein IPJ68_05900 [Candidatus Moranbacteria bacterium]